MKSFLNPEGHQNYISGSKYTVSLLKGLILPIAWWSFNWEGSAPAAWAAGLFLLKKSRIQETKHLSTDADGSTNAIRGWTKKIKTQFF